MENEKTKDLNSAFVFPLTDGQSFATDGMTKRFYAATKVVQGMLSNEMMRNDLLMDSKNTNINSENLSPAAYLVKYAYEYADELLKQE